MRNDMYENNWSPFNPKWYEAAFDQFVSTADQLFNQDLIIKQGFTLPDADGSRSSAFRNEAVLNNSFNEEKLRETLKDIYLNSTHKLVASNHDNVHFYQWHGYMSDMYLIPNTDMCQFTIPTDGFIFPKERDKFKLSQFYSKWIKPEDILNNWEIFKWHCMLFVNQKVNSEYELKIDDHEVTIRFKYYDYWVKSNYPIYIYKFDTSASCRILISKELCQNQWKWKLPVSYITDKRVVNSSNVMVAFNKINDSNIRKDGLTHVDVLGDNLEFLKIEDGYIDMTNISHFNNHLICSESTEWLWMSIIVPKFFHEYPTMLPTDIIYRPYKADFRAVVTSDNMGYRNTKVDTNGERKQVYVDLNGKLNEEYSAWKQMIRPMVLSDAYEDPFNEPYESFIEELSNLRDLTVKGADTIEDFRFFMQNSPTEDKFNEYVDRLTNDIDNIHTAYNAFLVKRMMETDRAYEFQYKKFHSIINEIKTDGIYSEWFVVSKEDEGTEKDFWFAISPQIYIPREMYDKYSIVYIIKSIANNGILWRPVEEFMDKSRFRRPIEENDFWTFEYDIDDRVWRPYHLNIRRQFPDVYLPSDPANDTPKLNKIYKAFFFYSDTMNVLEETGDIVSATPSWDNDMQEYEFDRGAVYRDIFMEKFYWMGIRSIYQGLLITKSRWECIEYVIDNSSYERFNKLFLETMDPYFKMGLATYLKSDNFGFPFDDAVDKMNEAINQNWIGFKKVTNFETYLNKTWIPSYFDYVTRIMDDWKPNERLIRRPRSSFDILRLLPLLLDRQDNINIAVGTVSNTIKWIISKLEEELYNLNIQNIFDIRDKIEEMLQNMKDAYTITTELDMDVYGIEDLNTIIKRLNHHIELTDELEETFSNSRQDVQDHNVYKPKKDILEKIANEYLDDIYKCIFDISAMVNNFDMEEFMLSTNDLYTYLEHDKNNPNDKSLGGYINQFNNPWSTKVKELRNNLYKSTSKLYGNFICDKAYTNEEVIEFVNTVELVKTDLIAFTDSINEFWNTMGYEKDDKVIDKLDYVNILLEKFIANLGKYMDYRKGLLDSIYKILALNESMLQYNISDTEYEFYNQNKNILNNLILSLSYIAGNNDRNVSLRYFQDFKNELLKWNSFILIEEEVFTKLISFTEPPIEFIERLRRDEATLKSMIDYMDTANIPYIPDSAWPTYSDVYYVDKIELLSGGFNHTVGEFVAVPNLGSYKITSVTDDSATAELLEDTGYRNTVYRDPMIQSNPYDAITSGNGMGISVKPIHSNRIPIINDELIKMVITRIQNTIYLVSTNIEIPNPYNNASYNKIIDDIEIIQNNWNETVNAYSDHMSEQAHDYINELMETLVSIIEPSKHFIDTRKNVDVGSLITDIDAFIYDCYNFASENNFIDTNYYYYEDNVKVILADLQAFYGNGTTWDDSTKLRELLDEAKYPIRLFKLRVIDAFQNVDGKSDILEAHSNILEKISSIENALSSLPNITVDISPIIRDIENTIKEMPEDIIHKDIWYRIRNVRVAMEGEGYKVGDVLSIVPELPKDHEGNPIYDMADVIMNDVILIRVKEVVDNRVTVLEPLMDYAIPYLLWGIRETKTLVGKGKGLTVDVYSYQIQLSDSTLLDDKSSDVSTLPQYNENDMFVFKFENIHDLNIQYEIFYGGKQITNFHQRHFSSVDNRLHPNSIDAIYLNANEVYDLRNSSVYIPAENYFIYRLDNVEIKDPGAGYAVGQEIFIDLDVVALRLKIASLIAGPTKGIAEVEMSDIRIKEKVDNPSCKNAKVVPDSMNNIDDEFNDGYYDQLTSDGIVKGATRSLDPNMYPFISRRLDSLPDGNRNKNYMYPDVDLPLVENVPQNGDPDEHWYLGSRIDNSQHPMEDDHKWCGIMNIIPPTDPFIPDDRRIPTGKPARGEYQFIDQLRIHNSIEESNTDVTTKFESSIKNAAMIEGDFSVEKFSQLPKHMNEWPDAKIGKCVIVENDETNNGHRMLYRLRTFVAAGFFVYDLPEIADYKWNHFYVDWMNCDFYPDIPSMKAKYPDAPWYDGKTFMDVQRPIVDGKYEDKCPVIEYNNSTYIHNITIDDLSVYNCNKHEWEDLHDETKWKLDVIDDPDNSNWGFKLTYLEEGTYSYDMQLYLNKTPDNQMRNASMKRDAIMDIAASLSAEVNNAAINSSVNTGRHLRIRKLFPYEQKETYTIGRNPDGSYKGYEMDFKLAPYIHYKNELHLEDVKIYNKSAGRFEDILDPKMFEVRFKDDRAVFKGYENQIRMIQSSISYGGESFVDGEVWAYNQEFNISVFGIVTANYRETGNILSFTPIHCVNPPSESIELEFQVYQRDGQTNKQMAVVTIEFGVEQVYVHGDGYIHNVINPLAPLPNEFKIICQYDLDELGEYDVIISKTPRQWKFIESKWIMCPTFHLPDYNIQQDRVYILTSNGRFPLKNPSTGKPSINVIEKDNGTDVTFLNLYKRYEHIEVRTTPYPMRSVYVQRKIPKSGYIDLAGKINKPLNKKYFEFWVNGKLLYDEVTIITPTKIFLHGLKSLKNFEIIEVNRDPNEYFSDTFLEVSNTDGKRPFHSWNYETYLDAALEGNLESDNYTPEEQEYLLSPVWKQVEKDHPEFKNFPPNIDIESDILVRVDDEDEYAMEDLEEPTYQFMILNTPTLEGYPIVDRSLSFETFGFIPMTDSMIIDIMNEEWEDEINNNPYFTDHSVMTDAEWYGMTARLYDEYGIRVHTLDESAYSITDDNLLRINVNSKLSRIIKNKISYDLT